MRIEKLATLKNAWKLAKGYWVSEERWRARGLLAAIVALNLGIVYINVLINAWRNTFYNVLNERNRDGFISALGDFSLLAGIFIVIAGYQLYLRMMLTIRWRKWLTEQYLGDWLSNQTFYRMKLVDRENTDNPDQRISEDINLFVSHALTLSLGLLREGVTLISFIVILWHMSGTLEIPLGQTVFVVGGYLVWAAIAYAGLGTWLTVKLGKPLVSLNFIQQRYEADFRFSLMRLRENSESVALYKGQKEEEKNFLARFQRVFGNYWQLMNLNKRLTWFTSGYGQLSIIFGILVAAPRYFANKISLGEMFQIADAYGTVQSSLSFFIDSFTQLAEWKAVIDRLGQFSTNMEKVQALRSEVTEPEIRRQAQPELAVEELDVLRPDGHRLLTDFSLRLLPGDSLLVSGPSGCGKSTLLRALAGIWPFGRGTINFPADKQALFLPQKSYIPIATLRQAIGYPGLTRPVEDDQLRLVLEECRLSFLAGRLDDMEDWAQVLSLGEQQRLAFARVLLQQPDILILDEATTALDEPTEQQLYRLIKEQLPQAILISVGHRSTLLQYHQAKLELDGRGGWTMLSAGA
ncbi:ABC transporter ATP-binding protein/permease [Propionispora vibrioides]|uniref:Putative ATP-binding cassette transporter n=1 Tax=Propionispora vibrioides TaxID=112903 RepID=A0A1H8VEX2_9FIRM|nr:ABC transporter ATP-binding protein/permease [Propionispora vibrioides]SEP13813.1 putative ATP-binding cassette transporter [Propionispora vibrioides]